jgi:hypothetical protein
MADSVLLKAIGNYFNYYYVSAVSQGDRIKYALKELDPEQEFKAFSGMTLTEFAGYGTFLENARKDLMLAIALCNSRDECQYLFCLETRIIQGQQCNSPDELPETGRTESH